MENECNFLKMDLENRELSCSKVTGGDRVDVTALDGSNIVLAENISKAFLQISVSTEK